MSKTQIKRFDKSLPLPEYKTKGAAAFDVIARETVQIKSGEIGYVPLNIAVKPPKGHYLMIAARSSTHKSGLMLANGLCIGDPDFCGDNDEYKLALLNFSKNKVGVERGTRIGQGVFIKFTKVQWREVSKMKSKDRGGFGSTGLK